MTLSPKRNLPIKSFNKVFENPKDNDKINVSESKNIFSSHSLKKINNDPQKRKNPLSFSKNVIKERNSNLIDFKDENGTISCRGAMQQYCLKGSDVILRQVYFIRNDKSKMLLLNVDNIKRNTDTYNILLTKDVCPYNFKDDEAFVIKVFDVQHRLKSMTFKAKTRDEKSMWLKSYGINMASAQIVLDSCIEEVERRRFHLGVKKRTEDQNNIKMTTDILINLVKIANESMKLCFTDETRWSVTSLERLIQLLLNELTVPLIPYEHQRSVRKSNNSKFNAANETRKMLNMLSNRNKAMLMSLLAHMERLSKYYLTIMSSPRKDLPRIRQNICQRLAPVIFRLQDKFDSDVVTNNAIDLLYHTMQCLTGAT